MKQIRFPTRLAENTKKESKESSLQLDDDWRRTFINNHQLREEKIIDKNEKIEGYF